MVGGGAYAAILKAAAQRGLTPQNLIDLREAVVLHRYNGKGATEIFSLIGQDMDFIRNACANAREKGGAVPAGHQRLQRQRVDPGSQSQKSRPGSVPPDGNTASRRWRRNRPMVSRWPARPETLIRRFEDAVRDRVTWPDNPQAETRYRLARANLLSRIYPATPFQDVQR